MRRGAVLLLARFSGAATRSPQLFDSGPSKMLRFSLNNDRNANDDGLWASVAAAFGRN
jgi:hypothetical protein